MMGLFVWAVLELQFLLPLLEFACDIHLFTTMPPIPFKFKVEVSLSQSIYQMN